MAEEGSRIPSIPQVRALHDPLWRLILLDQETAKFAWQQEDKFLAEFGPLADAVAAIRPLLGSSEGWSFDACDGLEIVARRFDDLTAALGWEELVQPEPARSEIAARLRAEFRDGVETSFFGAAMVLRKARWSQEPWAWMVNRFAEIGRSRGIRPTVSLEEAAANFKLLAHQYYQGLRFGLDYPRVKLIGDEGFEELSRAFNVIHKELQRVLGRQLYFNDDLHAEEEGLDPDLARNKLCYELWQHDRWSRPRIRDEVKRLAIERRWGTIESDPGVTHAIHAYAKPRGLPVRKGDPGRKRTGKK